MNRRAILGSLGSLLMAPAVVRASFIMPVRSPTPVADRLERILNRGGAITGGVFYPERTLVITGRGFILTGARVIGRPGNERLLDFGPTASGTVTNSVFTNGSVAFQADFGLGVQA